MMKVGRELNKLDPRERITVKALRLIPYAPKSLYCMIPGCYRVGAFEGQDRHAIVCPTHAGKRPVYGHRG